MLQDGERGRGGEREMRGEHSSQEDSPQRNGCFTDGLPTSHPRPDNSPVLSRDVRHDVLVEELEYERDAVGKHQVLGHELKL